jgi:ABC-2 type transport system permease protein
MNAAWTIARHELAIAYHSRRLLLLSGVATALVAIAVAQGAHDHVRDRDERARLAAIVDAEWHGQEPRSPHATHHFGTWVTKPRTALSIFDRGVEDYLGQHTVLDAHVKTPLVGSTAEDDPLRALFGGFDLGFVLAVLLPLLVVFGAHDAVAGDKQRGTLKATLSQPIRRRSYLAGKLIGQLAIFAIAFAPPLLVGLFAPVWIGVDYQLADVARLLAMFAAALVYVALFVFVALGVSASTHRPSSALAVLLGVWIAVVFLVPRAGVLVAEAVHPPAAPEALHHAQAELRAAIEERRAEAFARVVSELRRDHPEIPADFAVRRGDHGGRAEAGWQVDPTGVFASEANALVNDERARRIAEVRASGERAQALASMIALASPMTAFQRGTSALAGTDLARHRHFEAQVDRFFTTFGDHFNRLWASNVRLVTDVSHAPSFRYQPEPAAAAWARFGRAALALLAFTCGAAAFAMVRITRYDAR